MAEPDGSLLTKEGGISHAINTHKQTPWPDSPPLLKTQIPKKICFDEGVLHWTLGFAAELVLAIWPSTASCGTRLSKRLSQKHLSRLKTLNLKCANPF